MRKESVRPPPRKEPGIISKFFSRIIAVIFWLFVSLIISIVFEWIGIALFWSDQGSNHSKNMLETEYSYLNQRLKNDSNSISQSIYNKTYQVNEWVVGRSGISNFFISISSLHNDIDRLVKYLYKEYQHYIFSIKYTTQVFFVRIAIVLFSLPAFLISGSIGLVDGLVERELRRWGGGRESSNVYNIARKSVFPVFITACVLYVSLPVSIHPAWVIMPFVIFFGFSIRVAFERLKKNF